MNMGKASTTNRRIEYFNGMTRTLQERSSNQAQSVEKSTRLAFIVRFVVFVRIAFA